MEACNSNVEDQNNFLLANLCEQLLPNRYSRFGYKRMVRT